MRQGPVRCRDGQIDFRARHSVWRRSRRRVRERRMARDDSRRGTVEDWTDRMIGDNLGGTRASRAALDWERLARCAMHPVQVYVLEELRRGAASPRELAERGEKPLGHVSYHVRHLRALGLIELTSTRPVRGALEHFYALAPDVERADADRQR